ncbi:hypothetical protein [Rummeliibacillus sp. BSL5]
MAWGRDVGRKILRGYTAMDLQKRNDDYETRGWKQISKIQTECRDSSAYAVLMQLENKRKHA